MTFITSKDTIESLMGPAIRTQAATPAVSPRQQRMRAAGIRSFSESRLSCLSGKDQVVTTSDRLDKTLAQSSSGQLSHPQHQFSNQQHMAQFPPPTSLYSNTQQSRRRRSRSSLYNSSIDLGSRSSLAPVLETDLSPSEEKVSPFATTQPRKSNDSIHFSLPFSSSNGSTTAVSASGLGLLMPADQRSHALMTQSSPDLRSVLDHDITILCNELDSPYRQADVARDAHRSTPELTSSASFSSQDEEDVPRSSISSIDSLKSDASSFSDDMPESEYALHLRDLHRTPSQIHAPMIGGATLTREVSRTSKSSQLLGPESPTIPSMPTFPASTHAVQKQKISLKSSKILGPESPTIPSVASFSPSHASAFAADVDLERGTKDSNKSRWSFLKR